jgi:hypothetical protein
MAFPPPSDLKLAIDGARTRVLVKQIGHETRAVWASHTACLRAMSYTMLIVLCARFR